MHISDGILTAPVWLSGAAIAAGGVAQGLRQVREEEIPRVAMFSAAFFVASLIHVPIGGTSAHLVLNGLIGLVLGWAAFPAILVGLILQMAFFQFGGWTALGVNTLTMAAPAVACYLSLGRCVRRAPLRRATICGGIAGAAGILLGTILVAAALIASSGSFAGVAGMFAVSHAGIMVVEAMITAGVVGFLRQVRPEVLEVTSSRSNDET